MDTPAESPAADVWGGLAASLVTLPSALAFGVATFAPLGPSSAGLGAFAGLVGATVVGVTAPLFGGAPRLITTPCAPAAAVMGALAASLSEGGRSPERVVALMAVTALLSGGFQAVYGLLGGGRLIKFIPYPVVTGYLSAVAVIIFLGQFPKLLGAPGGTALWRALPHPAQWSLPGLAVGLATMAAMTAGPRLTRRVPAAILALLAGAAAYWALAVFHPPLRSLDGNKLVIGPLPGAGAASLGALAARWRGAWPLGPAELSLVLTPALTLSVLLSIDTLKSCVAVDALTRARHDSDKTLLGQGAANVLSALAGGVPGSGAIGATLVNVSSGGRTPLSGVLAGMFTLAAFLLIGRLVAWVPSAALAGILLVVAWKMFDRKSFRLLRQRSTLVDFAVSAAVVFVAVISDLIAAAGVGLGLSILLYIHDQILSSVIRRKTDGSKMFSKRRLLPDERTELEKAGARTVICELQGSLFFGTTDQLFSEIERSLPKAAFVVLDMRRVTSVDFTAVHMLKQIEDVLHEHGGRLLISAPPRALPSGVELQRYFDEVGLVKATRNVEVFPTLDDALTRAEDALLADFRCAAPDGDRPLAMAEMDLLRGIEPPLAAAMEAAAVARSVKAGQLVCHRDEQGDEFFLLRRGKVRIDLPLENGPSYHVTTFGRGDFFGEVAFLDRGRRSADALALTDCDLFVLSRARFDELARAHADLGVKMFARLAKTLGVRLRQADLELRALQEE